MIALKTAKEAPVRGNLKPHIGLTVCKVEKIEMYEPTTVSDADWQKAINTIPWENLIKPDDDFKFKIKFTPALTDLEDVKRFPCEIKVATFGNEKPSWQTITLDENDKFSPDKKELWVTITNDEMKYLGLMKDDNEDGVFEYCSYEATGSKNFNDSNQFDISVAGGERKPLVNVRFEGNPTDQSITVRGCTVPSWAAKDEREFFSSGGALYIAVTSGAQENRTLLENQADWFYVSAHGAHDTGSIRGTLPNQVNWTKDLEWFFIAGCAVLDVDDLNGNYDDDEDGEPEIGPISKVFPGEKWCTTGPSFFFGYNWYSPTDNHNGDTYFTAKIIGKYFELRKYHEYSYSWGYANKALAGGIKDSPYNACTIEVWSSQSKKYWYWDKGYIYNTWTIHSF